MSFRAKLYSSKRYWQQEGLHHALKNADTRGWLISHSVLVAEVASRIRNGMRVVELGCSGGHWFERLNLRERGCDYTGIDWNPDSVDLARKRHPDADFRLSDLTKISDLGEFDYVLACQILFFLDQPALERILSQMPPSALITLSEPSAYDIDSYAVSRPKLRSNKHGNKAVVYKHPYPSIVHRLGFDILSRQFTEFHPGKVKLVMTAQRKISATHP